jgi:hypothetical protein
MEETIMPSNYIKSLADKLGKSEEEIENKWKKAKKIAKDEGMDEGTDEFYAYVTGIVKKMLGLKEETTTANIPSGKPDGQYMGLPMFKCDDSKNDMFWRLHKTKRKHKQWYKTHYQDSNLAQWAKGNSGKDFYLYNVNHDMFRKVKA